MANTATLSAKVDPNVKNRLLAIANKVGKTESELLRNIVLDYLGEADPNSIESMQTRLAAVERKCNRMAKLMLNP